MLWVQPFTRLSALSEGDTWLGCIGMLVAMLAAALMGRRMVIGVRDAHSYFAAVPMVTRVTMPVVLPIYLPMAMPTGNGMAMFMSMVMI